MAPGRVLNNDNVTPVGRSACWSSSFSFEHRDLWTKAPTQSRTADPVLRSLMHPPSSCSILPWPQGLNMWQTQAEAQSLSWPSLALSVILNGQFKHQMLTQTQVVITLEFSLPYVWKADLRNTQTLSSLTLQHNAARFALQLTFGLSIDKEPTKIALRGM